MAAPMAFSGETEEVVLTVNGIKKVRLAVAGHSGRLGFPLTDAGPHVASPISAALALDRPPSPSLALAIIVSHLAS